MRQVAPSPPLRPCRPLTGCSRSLAAGTLTATATHSRALRHRQQALQPAAAAEQRGGAAAEQPAAAQRYAAPLAPADDARDPNEHDDFGQTQLMRAALRGDVARVQALLQRGADPNAVDSWDTTALMLAAGKGHAAVVRLLLQHGAQVDARDSCGRSALMAAALAGAFTQMANTVLARSFGFSSGGALEAAAALLNAGADVHATDECARGLGRGGGVCRRRCQRACACAVACPARTRLAHRQPAHPPLHHPQRGVHAAGAAGAGAHGSLPC